jgi:nucleoside 2-deoxyribosyltransferase
MRIYLACTVRGSRSGLAAARAAAETLTALGHEVMTPHLLEDDVERAEAAVTEREVYERDKAWLDACDAVVAEASGSTYGVGFEVGYVTGRAAASGQRVVVLYDAAARDRVSRLIAGFSDPRGAVCAYSSVADVRAFIEAHFGAGRSARGGGV